MIRRRFTILVLLIIILGLYVYRLTLIAELGTLIPQYVEHQDEIERLRKENSYLYQQILTETAIINLQRRSEELGLEPAVIKYED